MSLKNRIPWSGLVGVSIVLAGFGIVSCKKSPVHAAGAAATSASGATRQVAIIDPVLNRRAYSYTIPANWIFEGTVMSGTSCKPDPAPVARILSPDGITGIKQLPRLDWVWSSVPNIRNQPAGNCLPYQRELSASEVLQYMVGVLGVTFVKQETAPELAQYQQNIQNRNNANAAQSKGMPAMSSKGDMARFRVRYNINSIPVEEFLSATTLCNDSPMRLGQNVSHFHACSAWVARSWARQGNLDASRELLVSIAKSMVIDQQWNQQWMAIEFKKIQDASAAGTRMIQQMGADSMRRMQAQQNAFNQSQAMRQRQHQEFLSTMQRGTDMSMNRAQESSNARQRMAGDWADYALDQQKRRDPNTGLITKDSSQYSYTWVDSSGQRYQTNDINDNPNGRLNGNWTVQQNVR